MGAHCRNDQLHYLGTVLLSETMALCRHIYGNYVMQHLLTYGTAEQRSRFVNEFARNVLSGTDMVSLGVLNTAFEACDAEQCLILARAICSTRGILVPFVQRRRGHQTVKSVLHALPAGSADLEAARAELLAAKGHLSKSRYGRCVLRLCQQEAIDINDGSLSPMSSHS